MSTLETLDRTELAKAFGEMSGLDLGEQPLNTEARDALHSLAMIYLRHRSADRAMVLLLVALHIAGPTAPLLQATALVMLKLGNAEQALAALDRSEREFGATRESGILRARAVARLDGLAQGRAAMAEALARGSESAVPAGTEEAA